ncbi:MAG: hypothetical protein BWZ10_03079 [candidate division BRC1 bacterium ADurb.BinA364]|nr:MAG: hypothetical protein BWZ10_03079 [candidate division BRC1 bacterium ADurb.BinA364]
MPVHWAEMAGKGLSWCMSSFGPSRRQTPYPGIGRSYPDACAGYLSTANQLRFPDMFYDPSNGTISFGWVGRSNKGVH